MLLVIKRDTNEELLWCHHLIIKHKGFFITNKTIDFTVQLMLPWFKGIVRPQVKFHPVWHFLINRTIPKFHKRKDFLSILIQWKPTVAKHQKKTPKKTCLHTARQVSWDRIVAPVLESTVEILARNMVLTFSFWDKSDCWFFWTFGGHHRRSLVNTLGKGYHQRWVQFFPSAKLQNCSVD